jgi:5-methylcytosine-specific restriction enzyme subunit McrC
MTAIELDAWAERTIEDLTAQQASEISNSGLVTVMADRPPSRWRLKADSHIGVVLGTAWELRVNPALPVRKIMFLLGYAVDRRGWRDTVAAFGAERDLFSAVASGFAFHAERAISPAPIRGYVSVEDRAAVLRGRLRVADQIARWPAMPIPLEITYDDHTADIPENRMVRGAAELLLRFPRVPVAARKRLLRVRATLEDVTPVSPGPGIRAPEITRLNRRYEAVLALAELILRGSSITTHRGKVSSVSFVFDMNQVFEDFLSVALREALQRRGGKVELQHARQHLDGGGRIRLIPDITWWRGDRCLAVIDAKYKPLDDTRFPNADAYQMLAYCTGLRLPRGYLVYAKARDAISGNRRHHVLHAEKTIDVRAIDVDLEPDDLLANIDALAAEISSNAIAVASLAGQFA